MVSTASVSEATQAPARLSAASYWQMEVLLHGLLTDARLSGGG